MKFRVNIYVDFTEEDHKKAMTMAQGNREMEVILYILKAFGFSLDTYNSDPKQVEAELSKDIE